MDDTEQFKQDTGNAKIGETNAAESNKGILAGSLNALYTKADNISYLGSETSNLWGKDFRVEKYKTSLGDKYRVDEINYYYFDNDKLKIIKTIHNAVPAKDGSGDWTYTKGGAENWLYLYSVTADFDPKIISLPENIKK